MMSQPPARVRSVTAVFNLVFGGGLLLVACLRETPLFWQNAGGWPVWFRDLVKLGFYPGLFAFGFLVVRVVASGSAPHKPPARGRRLWWSLLSLTQIFLLIAILAIISWNNLVNLVEGAALHRHAR
jgi:hypothetical protein